MSERTIEDLKQEKLWLVWNYMPGKNGKITKVPFSAYGGATGTDEKYKDTLATYDEAYASMQSCGGSGLGFKIPEDMYFLDIDHREMSDPLLQKLLSRHNSYAEYSPSGNGIHILGTCDRGKFPIVYDEKKKRDVLSGEYYQKNPGNGVELYIGSIKNRFATFTGNVISDLPLTEGTVAVLTTLQEDMKRPEKGKKSTSEDSERMLFDVVAALRKQKNGEKFIKLYDVGDASDYGSQSEADAALCAMIAFRVGADAEAIDKVFRESKLYRDKWEREDCRESIIALGIQACHGVFHKSVMEHPEFIKFDEKTFKPYISVPLLAKYVREHMQYVLVRDNAKQALLKYVYEDGCYRLYADNMMMGRIKQYIAEYDEELVKMSKVAETLQHINTDLNYVGQDELNADESIINFQNGLLRVTATETTLEPHSPEVLSTIQIPCDWQGTLSPTPVFDEYLNTLPNGDKAVQELLLQFMGVCISNVKGWRMKKALFLVGDGDTGKSQLKSLVERLLGRGNFIGIDLKEIEARFGTGAVYDTRLAGSSDMSFLSVDELKTFKKMTGGDSLFAEFKGQQGFEFTYNGLLWFCMNRLAKFGGDDDILVKNPFGFQLAGVVVNDSVTREAISREQMRKFLKFVHDDVCYCKYYEVVYILFHTGMRISEFCGLTLKDIDLENRTVNIDHQLQRTCDMRYIIEETKTEAGKRKIPITEDVAMMFQAVIEDREPPKMEKVIDGYTGFLFYDDDGNPLVAMHWQHRFNRMVGRYNDIYRVQMPNITPHVCRHTYCSNMAKSGMNPKTLQYLMGHSDISVTMNVYTHISFDDAEEELKRMEEFRKAQAEIEKKSDAKAVSQKMFKVV